MKEELIKIEHNNIINNLVVNARDLHEFLEVGKDFSTWIKYKIKKYYFIENMDYIRIFFNLYNEKINDYFNEKPFKIEYGITLNMAKEIAMVQNNERGRQVRQYFIDVEKIYRNDYFSDCLNRLFLTPCFKKLRMIKTYFLRDAITEYIKIGKSINVNRRLKEIKSANPTVELITVIDEDVELKLHHKFEHKRMGGEWFNLSENDIENVKNNFNNQIL